MVTRARGKLDSTTQTKRSKFWDKKAKNYSNTEKRFGLAFEYVIGQTKKYLKNTDVTLDFGCATGIKTLRLSPQVKEIHGIDFAPKMIAVAEEQAKQQNITNAKFFTETIYGERLQKESYDVIISFGVIHLLDDYKDAIHRINELLKPGGAFISTTACLKEKMSLKDKVVLSMYRFIQKIGLFPMHLNFFNNTDVDRAFEEEAFEIVERKNIPSGISVYFVAAKKSK